MTTLPTARCAHCLSRTPESEARRLGDDVVCEACACLAGARPAAAVAHAAKQEAAANPQAIPAFDGDAGASRIAEELPPEEAVPTGMRPLWKRVLEDIDDWCQGRAWFVRAPLVLYFAYAWWRHASDPMYASLFKGMNLGIHELGHYVFAPFGEMMGAWGGSLFQCLVPLLAVPMFMRQRDYFAIFVALGWLGTNLFEVSTYSADAVAMKLPLVTPGGGHAIHDWNYILGAKGWLLHTETIAAVHRFAGHAMLALCVWGGVWVCVMMVRSRLDARGPGRPSGGSPT